MRRDMDLIRALLLRIEAMSFDLAGPRELAIGDLRIEGRSDEEVGHALVLMLEAGLYESGYSLDGRRPAATSEGSWYVSRLTWRGHDFLDTVRDPALWQRTKAAAAVVGGVSLQMHFEIGRAIARRELHELGILPQG